MTRARRGLIVIGQASTLRNNYLWRKWVNWARKRNLVDAQALPWVNKAVDDDKYPAAALLEQHGSS
eukprot:7844529-Pyramimonas_sp.AAC.1